MQAQPPQPLTVYKHLVRTNNYNTEREKERLYYRMLMVVHSKREPISIYDCGVIIENIYTNAAMSCQLPAYSTLSYDSYTDSYWVVRVAHHNIPLSVQESVDRVSRKKFQRCSGNMYM
jgi:hypothetical protein